MKLIRDTETRITVGIPIKHSHEGHHPKVQNSHFGWSAKTLRMRHLGSTTLRVYVGESSTSDMSIMFHPAILLDPNHFNRREDGTSIYSTHTVPDAISAFENIKIFNRFDQLSTSEKEILFMECYKTFSLLIHNNETLETLALENVQIKINPADTEDFSSINQWKPLVESSQEDIDYPDMSEYKLLKQNEIRLVIKPLNTHKGKPGRIERPAYSWAWNRVSGKITALNDTSNKLITKEVVKDWELPVLDACRRLDPYFFTKAGISELLKPQTEYIAKIIKIFGTLRDEYRNGSLGYEEKRKAGNLAGNIGLLLLHGDPHLQHSKGLRTTKHVDEDVSIPARHLSHTITSLPEQTSDSWPNN